MKSKIFLLKSDNFNQFERNIEKIEQLDVDLIISLSCNQIFKQRLLETPKKGCINLHCSALPRYRGLMPSFWTIFHEETVSAATVFYIDSGIDTGPIIVQDLVDIRGLNQEEVINLTKQVGISSICEAVNRISEGTVELVENDNENSSYFGFPTRQDVRLFRKKGDVFFEYSDV